MKKVCFLFFCIISTVVTFAQETIEISFADGRDTIRRTSTPITYDLVVKVDSVKINTDSLLLYTLIIKVIEEESTFPKTDYQLFFNTINLRELKSENHFFITLKGDSIVDRDRVLRFRLEVLKNDKKSGVNVAQSNTTHEIIIQGFRTLNKYNYLGYIGTNFDLVDGVKTKDIFFAVNIFTPPQYMREKFGFNLGLYGNRTLTLTDNATKIRYSRVVGLSGDSVRNYTEEATKSVSRVSDNLGATFSPLLCMGFLSDPESKAQLYYAPQVDFIWRRTQITTTYKDAKSIDSVDMATRPQVSSLALQPSSETIPINVYDVYLGWAGLLLNHENKFISMRLQGSFGNSFSYIAIHNNAVTSVIHQQYAREWNWFCYVRAWITEPSSGLTFGAEVSNTMFRSSSYQPYFNVTLSKALNLNAIGALFQPVTSR